MLNYRVGAHRFCQNRACKIKFLPRTTASVHAVSLLHFYSIALFCTKKVLGYNNSLLTTSQEFFYYILYIYYIKCTRARARGRDTLKYYVNLQPPNIVVKNPSAWKWGMDGIFWCKFDAFAPFFITKWRRGSFFRWQKLTTHPSEEQFLFLF